MPSVRARLFALAVRLSGKRKFFARDDHDPADFVAKRQAPALPGRAMARRFDIRHEKQDGFDVYVVAPRSKESAGDVLYLHGGGFILPINGLHWRFIAQLAEATGFTFTVPLYPLAPEHDCARASQIVTDAYRAIVARNTGGGVVVMGDSAGAGLALSLAMQWQADGLPSPRGIVLVSPWLDVTMTDPSQAEIEPLDVLMMRPGLRQAGIWFAGNLSTSDGRISPLHGDLAGLPPIHMVSGTHDIVVTDARRLAARSRTEGIDLVYHEEPGLMHNFILLPIPEARRAQARIVDFLQARLSGS